VWCADVRHSFDVVDRRRDENGREVGSGLTASPIYTVISGQLRLDTSGGIDAGCDPSRGAARGPRKNKDKKNERARYRLTGENKNRGPRDLLFIVEKDTRAESPACMFTVPGLLFMEHWYRSTRLECILTTLGF